MHERAGLETLPQKGGNAVSEEISRNRRRLAASAAFCVFWGAFLVAIGFPAPFVVAVLGGIVAAAAIHVEGRRLADALRPRLRGRAASLAGAGRGVVGASHRAARGSSRQLSRVDWARLAAGGRERAKASARSGRRAASAAGALGAAAARRTVTAGAAAVSAVEAVPRRHRAVREARRLNEEAAALRHAGKAEEALEVGERALQLVRTAGDSRAEALTLNGLGLAQARAGDEIGALDSYETAVALLSALGDRRGAGLVLANIGALHRVQGDEDKARAAWVDALERLEPGTPEHERTAQQLKIAS